MRHFLKESDLSREEIAGVFATAAALNPTSGRSEARQ